MRSVAFRTCVEILRQRQINPDCLAIDVGGARYVVLDNATGQNPLLTISPQCAFLDAGFLDKPDYQMDFLSPAAIAKLLGLFDLAYCFDTLEHVADPFLWARHLLAILRPGGYVYLSTVFQFPYHPSPQDYWRFTPAGLRQLFNGLKGEVLWADWEPPQPPHIAVAILVRKNDA